MKAFGQNYEKHPNYIIQYPIGTNQMIIPQISNSNLIYTGYNSVPIQNNCQVNAIYSPAQISNQNIIIPKPIQSFNVNQVLPLNNPSSNLNQNVANLENNISQMKKNIITSKMNNESYTGHKPIPVKLVNKTIKSICKIIVSINNKTHSGTGFFMKVSNSLKFLITNYHVISPEIVNQNITIETWNNKKIKLNCYGRYIIYMKAPKDITAIEIKESDEIYKDLEFLNYDSNYNQDGYKIYNNVDIFSIEHPLGEDASTASGKIIGIDGFEFIHDISTDDGSSGCPIILLFDNINIILVIGIHKNSDNKNNNGGTFIGELINEINKDLTKNKNNIKNEELNKIKENRKIKPINQIDLNNDNSLMNEGYIPYSCIPKLEKNDLSFNCFEEK